MGSIKIRVKAANEDCDIENLHKSLSKSKIKYSKINCKGNIYEVFCNESSDADNMFSDVCLNTLVSFNFQPIMPMELKSKRCVIIKRLDSQIYGHSEEELFD